MKQKRISGKNEFTVTVPKDESGSDSTSFTNTNFRVPFRQKTGSMTAAMLLFIIAGFFLYTAFNVFKDGGTYSLVRVQVPAAVGGAIYAVLGIIGLAALFKKVKSIINAPKLKVCCEKQNDDYLVTCTFVKKDKYYYSIAVDDLWVREGIDSPFKFRIKGTGVHYVLLTFNTAVCLDYKKIRLD